MVAGGNSIIIIWMKGKLATTLMNERKLICREHLQCRVGRGNQRVYEREMEEREKENVVVL